MLVYLDINIDTMGSGLASVTVKPEAGGWATRELERCVSWGDVWYARQRWHAPRRGGHLGIIPACDRSEVRETAAAVGLAYDFPKMMLIRAPKGHLRKGKGVRDEL